MGSYRELIAAQIRSYTTYRASFAIEVSTQALVPLLDLAALLAILRVTPGHGGFTGDEVLVMFGISSVAFALADLAVGRDREAASACSCRRPGCHAGATVVAVGTTARERLRDPAGRAARGRGGGPRRRVAAGRPAGEPSAGRAARRRSSRRRGSHS